MCNTETLDPVVRSALELLMKTGQSNSRELLKYRKYFTDNECSETQSTIPNEWRTAFIPQYWEDENGAEMPLNEVAALVTGDPTAVFVPSGFQQHDIDLWLAGRQPVTFNRTLTQNELEVLAYFVRDIRELLASSFLNDGPGTIQFIGEMSLTAVHPPEFKSAVTDEEIRSFVTIFRRLYMKNEKANFKNAVDVLIAVFDGHPRAKWIKANSDAYAASLNVPPDSRPFFPKGTCPFSVKELLDAFIYTQYAHQPDDNWGRAELFERCLAALHGRRGAFMWLFCSELYKCSLFYQVIGKLAAWWLDEYLTRNPQQFLFVDSISKSNPGIGELEKSEDKKARLFQEESAKLAHELWVSRGRPEQGPSQFLDEAQAMLRKHLESDE